MAGGLSCRGWLPACSVILTPHIAGVTEMSYRSMAEVVAAAVLRLRHGQAPRRRLNDPAHPRALDWLT